MGYGVSNERNFFLTRFFRAADPELRRSSPCLDFSISQAVLPRSCEPNGAILCRDVVSSVNREISGVGMCVCSCYMRSRSRTTTDHHISTMPGRSTSGFHRPGRHRVHQEEGGKKEVELGPIVEQCTWNQGRTTCTVANANGFISAHGQ